MSIRDREGLIARIRLIRRTAPSGPDPRRPAADPDRPELQALQARVAHLEQMVQGLQDSVHRESTRLSNRIGELEAQVQPAALGKALSEDARNRGL
ncbi:MAG TPA: hypothetical protein VMP89_18605 [Solirubrobacteraceae bacterium]|nr:hypothetical protein [Solirubrobacteraceae bacterium]